MNIIKEEKYASTRHDVIDVIRKRWSPRSFAEDALETAEIKSILEAASWAPSAMNEQPWRFAVAMKEDAGNFDKLASLLFPGNHVWASNAAALVVVFAVSNYSRNGKVNINASHDVGMATQNLLLQAVSMDIYGHVMEGFDKDEARRLLNLREEVVPVSMIALGRLGDPEQLEEPYYSRETTGRLRRSIEESLIEIP